MPKKSFKTLLSEAVKKTEDTQKMLMDSPMAVNQKVVFLNMLLTAFLSFITGLNKK